MSASGSFAIPAEALRAVETAVRDLDDRQVIWLSGYLAGSRAEAAAPIPEPAPPVAPDAASLAAPAITILYGSQSGNAKSAALALAERMRAGGGAAQVHDMAHYKTAALKRERLLGIVISTQGEGEPPDSARRFCEFLDGRHAPKLPDTRFSVLALGDSGYEHFCKTGRDLDQRLAELGAQRLLPVVECDADFEAEAAGWRERVANELLSGPEANVIAINDAAIPAPAAAAELSAGSRENPVTAEVMNNICLTGDDPDKCVHHLELSLANSRLSFAPGDSLGVWPETPESLITATLDALGATGDEEVEIHSESMVVQEWLARNAELSLLSPAVVMRWAERQGVAELVGRQEAAAFADGRTAADLFRRIPAAGDLKGALESLRRLSPRLYSLASSPAAREGEAHLLVGVCRHKDTGGTLRDGLCSGYLSALAPGSQLRVFAHENEHFRLPEDDAAPLIMIGPGTGVAPFRAFLEEREARGAGGRNWLFFGERRRREHFLYQTELRQYQASGLLTRMDVAFSRDGAGKVYVQHRMLARAEALWDWLCNGACLRVCGDAQRMARDVEATLLQIISEQGGMSGPEASAVLAEWRDCGRYQRDVY